jgi:hypothetical protein
MQNELQTTGAGQLPDRWTLIRDIAVLQGKLIIDGLRDLILVPVSIAAGIVSLLKTGDGPGGGPGTEFYDLLRVGRSTERWINLFGAADRVHGRVRDEDISPVGNVDELVKRLESYIVDEYKSGGVTWQAKNRLDKALDILHKRVRGEKF